MGTPEFAVASLKALIDNNYEVVAVVTAPDKPAGRGLKLMESPVKQFAVEHHIKVLQPTNLKAPAFQEELEELQANLYVVVAFRMLPQAVWSKPIYGTFNLHASLLPDYRGAAPINRAIMNGETVTGVTTFFLNNEIDTGKVMFREKVAIGKDETAGSLHDRLMEAGASLVIKTVRAIEADDYPLTDQASLSADPLKEAPKLFKEDGKINWALPSTIIYNQIRGLDPYPAAWSELIHKTGKQILPFKIFGCKIVKPSSAGTVASIHSDQKNYMDITTGDQDAIRILELQVAGKRKMTTPELLRGFKLEEYEILL
jgi:methionyl-tRNA formyltransferase